MESGGPRYVSREVMTYSFDEAGILQAVQDARSDLEAAESKLQAVEDLARCLGVDTGEDE